MNRDAAIGIFDSGVGGLTVLHAVLGALPHEHLIYLGEPRFVAPHDRRGGDR